MILFWSVFAIAVLVVLAWIAPTLLRRRRIGSDTTASTNIAIAREHLAELVEQNDAGELSEEEFEHAKRDLELALAQDLEGTGGNMPSASAVDGRWALLAAAVVIPLLAVPLYYKIGSPQLIGTSPPSQFVGESGDSGQAPPIREMVRRLGGRLEIEPGNAEGWFLLGNSYMQLQDFAHAVRAFEKVVALLPDEPAGLLSLADALTMLEGRQVGPRAVQLLEKALTLDPGSPTGLWLLGKAAMDRGNVATGLVHWQRAYPLLAAQPRMQHRLGQMIASAVDELPASHVMRPGAMLAAAPISGTEGGATVAPSGAIIRIKVALAAALSDRVAPTDTLFVLARAQNGPPMPLAVARHTADELPISLTLSDAMAMIPAMKISSYPRVRVIARISKSGQASGQSGDLFSSDTMVDSTQPPESVSLLIDQIVP